jgi:molecular chaperone GrpE
MSSRSVAKRTAAAVLSRTYPLVGNVGSLPAPATIRTRLSPNAAIHPNLILSSRHLASSQVSWFSSNSNNNNNNNTANEEAPPKIEQEGSSSTTQQQEPSAAQDKASEMTLEQKIELLESQVKDLKDQVIRGLAEQENTRRIAQRDVEQARQFAIKSFAKSLLDVADNLERALNAVPDAMEKDRESHPVLANLYEGIEMTEKGLLKTFEMNGLVKYGKAGEVFDPNLHEALFEYPDPEKQPGTVGQILKPGFMLNKRVLRPAEVGVIKKA